MIAILRREFASYFNSPIAYVFFTVFLVAMTTLFYVFWSPFLSGQAEMRDFFFLLPWTYLFIVPAVSMRLWSEEKKMGTFELLMTFPHSAWKVVVAKYVAALGVLTLALLLTFPIPVTLELIGQPDWGAIRGGYAGAFFLGMAYLALGAFFSSVTENQIIAFVLSLVGSFFFFLLGSDWVLDIFPPGLREGVGYLSLGKHFESVQRGVLDSRDVLYYLSFSGVFLFLNFGVVEGRRWSSAFRVNYCVALVAVLGMFAALPVLGRRAHTRWDLTEGKVYTLAPVTERVLRNLDDLVTIRFWASTNLPSEMLPVRREVTDMLEEFSSLAGNRLVVERIEIDPKSSEEAQKLAQDAATAGVQEFQVNVLDRDRQSQTAVVFGLALSYADKSEALPVLANVAHLEYDLLSAILRMTRKRTPRIGIVAPASDRGDNLGAAREAFRQEFEVTNCDLSGGEAVPEEVDALLVVKPTNLSEREVFELDQYLVRGGNLVVLIDTYDDPTTGFWARPITSGLDDLLAHWGIEIGANVVADYGSMPLLTVRGKGGRMYMVEYPLWPAAQPTKEGADMPFLKGVNRVRLPWASTVTLVDGKQPGAQRKSLLESTEWAKLLTGSIDLDPAKQTYPERGSKEGLESRPLAAVALGRFTSMFEGKPIPEPLNPPEEGEAPPPPREVLTEGNPAKLLVVGDAGFPTDGHVGQSAENVAGLVLLFGVFDWMTAGEGLVSIRSRNVSSHPVDAKYVQEKDQRVFWIALDIVGVPLLLVLFGVSWALWRRRPGRKAAPASSAPAPESSEPPADEGTS